MGKALPEKGQKGKRAERPSYRSRLCSGTSPPWWRLVQAGQVRYVSCPRSNRTNTTHAFPLATDTSVVNTCLDMMLTCVSPNQSVKHRYHAGDSPAPLTNDALPPLYSGYPFGSSLKEHQCYT